MTVQEYDALLQSAAREKILERQIETLQNYRKNGVTTLADARKFDEELRRRV